MSALVYRPELDGLRALAIGLVTLDHVLHDRFPGGFVGVDIFFVLSGYLITSLLMEESARTNHIDLKRFYVRRFLRLAPALFFMLALYATAMTAYALWTGKAAFAEQHLWGAAAAASYLQDWNLALGIGSPGYLTHTWSLSIEEQFYLLWPLLVIVALRSGRTALIGLCVVLLVACNIWRAHLWLDGATPIRIYAGFDTRFDNLLVGCLLALTPLPVGLYAFLSRHVWLPLMAMLACLVWLRWDSGWYQAGMISTSILAGWILVAVLIDPYSRLSLALQLRPVNYIGRISYGYYLWHFPIWLTLGWFLPGHVFIRAILTIAVALPIALMSYHWLELPVRKLTLRKAA